MPPILVVDYDPGWPESFAQLRAAIWPLVRDVALSIEHVGSTSVPGLAAKPIIDMTIVVSSGAEVGAVIERLAPAGYLHQGNLGIEGREAFDTSGREPRHHLYAAAQPSVALANHLMVRSYLRQHPEMAHRYGVLKKQLAREFAHDIDRYVDGKTSLILEMLRDAGCPAAHLATIERGNRKTV